MTNTNQNHDDSDASNRKRLKTFDKGGVAPWSDLHHHVLLLVMMRLGVFDFLAFSGVCKSWRSLALLNKNMFMSSRPPMEICIEPRDNNEGSYCCLRDIDLITFQTILPHSHGRICFGSTCGYLILFGQETRDFWLVNPVTRHELHFPNYPLCKGAYGGIRAILVFSRSISALVLVVLHRNLNLWHRRAIKPKISFCIAGKRRWNHVASTVNIPIIDLHVFKGNIYTLSTYCCLGELRLDLKHKGKSELLEIKTFQKPNFSHPWLVSSNENLFVIDRLLRPKKVLELDFGEMKWASAEKTKEEHAFYLSFLNSCVAMKQNQTRSKRYHEFLDSYDDRDRMYYYKWTWYFPHHCLNVNILDE